MTPTDHRYQFACDTAREAGALALSYFRDFRSLTVTSKGIQDMASEADVNTENLIRDAVNRHFPEDAFLGEESSDTFQPVADSGTWIVDPVDGTQPFVNGIPSWCVSMAYVENGRICVGVTYDPVHEELFAAQAGKGASLNGKPIRTSPAKNLHDGMVSIGYSNRVSVDETLQPLGRLMQAHGMYHRNGSGALSLAYVGAGRLIGYFEPHMNAWDFAAGALIITEAGGRCLDCLPNEQAMTDGGPMLAAADGVYDELLRLIYPPG